MPLEHEVRRYKRLADKSDLVIDVVTETAREGGQTLIFVSSRCRAEQLAAELSAAGQMAAHHHAGLAPKTRKCIETDFRSGQLVCLVATPTLEMGLNLPCRTVVIADNTRWNGETFEPLPVWNYLQRAGRAGRPGQDGAGRAVLLAPTWARGIPDYGCATPEPIRSHLGKPSKLAEQVLIEVTSRSCRTKAQLVGAFLPSTLAYQHDPHIVDRFADCLNVLISGGLLTEESSGILNATKVGWVAVRHQLSPGTARHLLDLSLRQDPQLLTSFDLLLHHCWDTELQPRLPVQIEVVEALEDQICGIPSHLLDTAPPVELAPRACAAGVLMATLMWFLLQGQEVDGICQSLDIYPSDAEVLRQSLVRLMYASADLHTAADPLDDPEKRRLRTQFCGPSLASRIRRIALQLEHGLPGDAVFLTLMPGCGGKLARRLLEVGVSDLDELCLLDPSDLARIPGIGLKRATDWIKAADYLIKEIDPFPESTVACRPRTVVAPSNWPGDIDPGRLQRALTLKVEGTGAAYWVSGGAEDHRVQSDRCDCADFKNHQESWWCKHRLAVRLSKRDPVLMTLTQRLSALLRPDSLARHLADMALGRRWQHV